MPTISVHCYKGVGPTDQKDYNFDSITTLADVRSQLVKNGFVPPDSDAVALRFVAFQSKSSNLSDALIVLSVEAGVPLSFVLGPANQLILTNINATQKPDLIGIATTQFFNRYLGVSVFLNNIDPAGADENKKIGAFEPLMLTNVKPTSSKVVGIYDNVCICVENSVVGFRLSSWGAVGYQEYIAPDMGDPIVEDDLFLSLGRTPNTYASTAILRYSRKQQTIQIVGADSVGISGEQSLRFQKVVFRTRRMTHYEQDGTSFDSDQMPPPLVPPALTRHAQVAHGVALEQNFSVQKQLANAPAVVPVPGSSIKTGGTVAGPPSNQNWNAPINNARTDDPSQALGEVVVYFFVFKSHEDAVKVINGYNAPDPSLWS